MTKKKKIDHILLSLTNKNPLQAISLVCIISILRKKHFFTTLCMQDEYATRRGKEKENEFCDYSYIKFFKRLIGLWKMKLKAERVHFFTYMVPFFIF